MCSREHNEGGNNVKTLRLERGKYILGTESRLVWLRLAKLKGRWHKMKLERQARSLRSGWP